jgi:hypothetical protein
MCKERAIVVRKFDVPRKKLRRVLFEDNSGATPTLQKIATETHN